MTAREFAGRPANFHYIPKYVWEWMGARMRVDEKVRQSVVFIGVETPTGFMPYGTGLLGLAIFEDLGNVALVTAKHVIDSIHGDEFAVRLNKKDGATECKVLKKRWMIHLDDKAIDLAVFPFDLAGNWLAYDIFMIPLTSSSWEWQIETLGTPGPGDEVCVVGLYTTHFGQIRNIPVVRIGHIAALPEEKVMTDQGYVTGYLIECHSIAGLSGSPVYWSIPQLRVVDGKIQQFKEATYVPLGILIGYHVIESREDAIIVPQFQTAPEERDYAAPARGLDERRTGFGVVIPIQNVYSIFEGDWMQKLMAENVKDLRKKSGFRPASAAPVVDTVGKPASSIASDENPQHREDFTSLLSAAAKKKPQAD